MRISDWSSDVCSSDLSAVEPVCSDFRAARARRACRIFLQDEIEQTAVLDRRRPHHSARAAKMHDLPLRIWRTDDVRGELLRCTRPRWVAAGSQLSLHRPSLRAEAQEYADKFRQDARDHRTAVSAAPHACPASVAQATSEDGIDRKSTRLNSSH